ncbi:MAG: HipA domain-containing protein [Alphaproteobacteria bacterium]|jgi:serine/threonine-protein kinase HipA|nr:HipA domain-containing protein [Alphaproteobacteria bacterium]
MAKFLWGKVFFNNTFAGYLRQEPGDRTSFTYDNLYVEQNGNPVSYHFPVRSDTYYHDSGLHPFFDNLVAEGWLEHAQIRLLGKRITSRFELLLAFGADCAGAVSVIDPEPQNISNQLLDLDDPKELALLTNRSSLSGVQPKLTLSKKDGGFYPTQIGETSTYIAKFPSAHHPGLIFNEYLTMKAFKHLLPDDEIVDLIIGDVQGQIEPALIIKRFDRNEKGKIHFEEFNQLLNRPSREKYEGSHKDMSDFIQQTPGCILTENYRLFRRILVGILLGNTDMHLKNFAMFHTPEGLRLTPSYDQVASVLYQYKTIALSLGGVSNLTITELKPKHILILAKEFNLSLKSLDLTYQQLKARIESAKQSIFEDEITSKTLKETLITLMEKRWNGTFALIGQSLSKKP